MNILELTSHIHKIRNGVNGKQPGTRLNYNELWNIAEKCSINGVSKVRRFGDLPLPDPKVGTFMRVRYHDTGREEAHIYISSKLEPGWEEFVFCKEIMHCWSPASTHVSTPLAAAELLGQYLQKSGILRTSSKLSDDIAIIAAANVMLPRSTVIGRNSRGEALEEIAHKEDLPLQIVQELAKPIYEKLLAGVTL